MVFIRQEGRRQISEHGDDAKQQQCIDHEGSFGVAQDPGNRGRIAISVSFEDAVEPREETGLLLLTTGMRLEHGCAECRGENQRDQYREPHRGDDRDGELPVDDPCGAAKESHRHEHGTNHQADAY
ncbi:hypothetical protein D9M71_611150 [compost metagenome]